MTWAELTQVGDHEPRRVLVNPAGVMLLWVDEGGAVTLRLATGDRLRVRESYDRVSTLLHEAAQAGAAA